MKIYNDREHVDSQLSDRVTSVDRIKDFNLRQDAHSNRSDDIACRVQHWSYPAYIALLLALSASGGIGLLHVVGDDMGDGAWTMCFIVICVTWLGAIGFAEAALRLKK